MVGPPTEADLANNRRRLAAGLVTLVALSSGLTAAYGGADPVTLGIVGLAGAAVGAVLVVTLGAWP